MILQSLYKLYVDCRLVEIEFKDLSFIETKFILKIRALFAIMKPKNEF